MHLAMSALLKDNPEFPSTIKPPLKWAGGKRWLVPFLKPLWEPYRPVRLVEPFCGGLSMALGLSPSHALLNDINSHLINFYRWLQKGFRSAVAMKNDPLVFYGNRRRFNRLLDVDKQGSAQAAALFYYLNRTGYNGLCRFNQSGKFNVPFGRYSKIHYVKDFSTYRKALANWDFTSVDFEKILLQPSDFIYADPPYDVEFTQYAKEGFRWEDQVRLVKWLARHPGPAALSNQATPRIIKLYRDFGFTLHFLKAPRMISCTGNREKAREVLACKGL